MYGQVHVSLPDWCCVSAMVDYVYAEGWIVSFEKYNWLKKQIEPCPTQLSIYTVEIEK